MSRKFQRKIEDFFCQNCGYFTKGNGYTNHCPNCLWSKHVDNNPGDRENECLGMMKPIQAYYKKGKWFVVHQCQRCQTNKIIKITAEDKLEVIKQIIAAK